MNNLAEKLALLNSIEQSLAQEGLNQVIKSSSLEDLNGMFLEIQRMKNDDNLNGFSSAITLFENAITCELRRQQKAREAILESKVDEIKRNIYEKFGDNIFNTIEARLVQIKESIDNEFSEIAQSGQIKGYWKRYNKNNFKQKLIGTAIKEALSDNIDKKYQKSQDIKNLDTEVSISNVIFSSVEFFKHKISTQLYEPLDKKRKESEARKQIALNKKMSKPTGASKEKKLDIQKEKVNILSPEQEALINQTIEFFTMIAQKQKVMIDERKLKRDIPRILTNEHKDTRLFDHLAKRFRVTLPVKGGFDWPKLRELMSKANDQNWSKKEKPTQKLTPKTESNKKEKPISGRKKLRISRSERIKNKLVAEIQAKESFTFKDFTNVIQTHDGFTTTEKAFNDFQKEFKTNQQKRILLCIIKKPPSLDRNRANSNSLYNKWSFIREGWRIVAPKNEKVVNSFYNNHDSYERDLNNGKI